MMAQVDQGELYFLILKAIGDGPCKKAFEVLQQEARVHNLLPVHYDYQGSSRPYSFAELREQHLHVPSTALLDFLNYALQRLRTSAKPGAKGLTTLLGTGELSGLKSVAPWDGQQLPWPRWLHPGGTPANVYHTMRLREDGWGGRRVLPVPLLPSKLQHHGTMRGHRLAVYCMTFDRSGRRVVTGSDDWLVKIWSVDVGLLLCTCRGHEAEVTDFAVNAANTMVASSSNDKTVRVWSLKEDTLGHPVSVLLGHTASVSFIDFCSVAPTVLLSSSLDGTCRVWNATDAAFSPLVLSATAPLPSGGAAAQSHTGPDGPAIRASSSMAMAHGQAHHMEEATASAIMTEGSSGDPTQLLCCAFSPCGTFIVAGGNDCRLHIWHWPIYVQQDVAAGGSRREPLPTQKSLALAAAEHAGAFGNARTPPMVDLEGGDWPSALLVNHFPGHRNDISIVVFSHGGEAIATASKDGHVRVWVRQVGKHGRGAAALCWLSKHTLSSPLDEAELQRAKQKRRPPPVPSINQVAWALDDAKVLAAVSDTTVRVWCAVKGSALHTLRGHSRQAHVLECHPHDHRLVMSAAYDGLTIIWDIVAGKALTRFDSRDTFPGPGPWPSALQLVDGHFSPDGNTLAVADVAGQLHLYGHGQPSFNSNVPYDQFLMCDYEPVQHDVHGHVVMADSQLAPHVLPRTANPYCNFLGDPYPEPLQSALQSRCLRMLPPAPPRLPGILPAGVTQLPPTVTAAEWSVGMHGGSAAEVAAAVGRAQDVHMRLLFLLASDEPGDQEALRRLQQGEGHPAALPAAGLQQRPRTDRNRPRRVVGAPELRHVQRVAPREQPQTDTRSTAMARIGRDHGVTMVLSDSDFDPTSDSGHDDGVNAAGVFGADSDAPAPLGPAGRPLRRSRIDRVPLYYQGVVEEGGEGPSAWRRSPIARRGTKRPRRAQSSTGSSSTDFSDSESESELYNFHDEEQEDDENNVDLEAEVDEEGRQSRPQRRAARHHSMPWRQDIQHAHSNRASPTQHPNRPHRHSRQDRGQDGRDRGQDRVRAMDRLLADERRQRRRRDRERRRAAAAAAAPSPALARREGRASLQGVPGPRQQDRYHWLLSTALWQSMLYIPQVGDEVVYLAAVHERGLDKKNDKVEPRPRVELEASQGFSLREAEPCTVTALRYEVDDQDESTVPVLTLRCDAGGGADGVEFEVKVPAPFADMTEYVVLRSLYERSAARAWTTGDVGKAWYFNGDEGLMQEWKFTVVEDKLAAASSTGALPQDPYSQPLMDRYAVEWADGEEINDIHPWEMFDIEEEASGRERSLLTPAGCAALAHVVSKAKKRFPQYATPVDVTVMVRLMDSGQEVPYNRLVALPLSLEAVEARLSAGFYRRMEVLLHDVHTIVANAVKVHGDTSEWGLRALRMEEWLTTRIQATLPDHFGSATRTTVGLVAATAADSGGAGPSQPPPARQRHHHHHPRASSGDGPGPGPGPAPGTGPSATWPPSASVAAPASQEASPSPEPVVSPRSGPQRSEEVWPGSPLRPTASHYSGSVAPQQLWMTTGVTRMTGAGSAAASAAGPSAAADAAMEVDKGTVSPPPALGSAIGSISPPHIVHGSSSPAPAYPEGGTPMPVAAQPAAASPFGAERRGVLRVRVRMPQNLRVADRGAPGTAAGGGGYHTASAGHAEDEPGTAGGAASTSGVSVAVRPSNGGLLPPMGYSRRPVRANRGQLRVREDFEYDPTGRALWHDMAGHIGHALGDGAGGKEEHYGAGTTMCASSSGWGEHGADLTPAASAHRNPSRLAHRHNVPSEATSGPALQSGAGTSGTAGQSGNRGGGIGTRHRSKHSRRAAG